MQNRLENFSKIDESESCYYMFTEEKQSKLNVQPGWSAENDEIAVVRIGKWFPFHSLNTVDVEYCRCPWRRLSESFEGPEYYVYWRTLLATLLELLRFHSAVILEFESNSFGIELRRQNPQRFDNLFPWESADEQAAWPSLLNRRPHPCHDETRRNAN